MLGFLEPKLFPVREPAGKRIFIGAILLSSVFSSINLVKGLGCFWFIRTGFGVCPRHVWVRMSVNLQVFYRVPVEIGGGNAFFRESFWALRKLRRWMTRTWKATSLFSASTGYPSDFTPSALSNIEKEFYCRQFSIHLDKHYRDN